MCDCMVAALWECTTGNRLRLISVLWRPNIGWAEGCCQASGVPKSRSPLRKKFWGALVLQNALQSEQVRLRRATHRRGRFVLCRCTSNAQPVFSYFLFCLCLLFVSPFFPTPSFLLHVFFFRGILFCRFANGNAHSIADALAH